MRSLLSIVFIAVLLGLTSAKSHRRSFGIPIHKRSTFTKNGVVNLDAVRSHIAYSKGKYLRGVSAMKYSTGTTSPSSSGHTVGRRAASGVSVPLTDYKNFLWYGKILVGSPPVEYTVDFDTGSADLFLPSSDCDNTCDGHTRYNPGKSFSAVNMHRGFHLAYGSGDVFGDEYTDTVTIGQFVAKSQRIGAALNYSTGFQADNFAPDGLMGMAFSDLSVWRANSVVQTLIAEGQLSDLVFAFKLASSGSELYIGGVNQSLYKGNVTYAPVTVQAFWRINVDSLNANGQAISKNIPAIVDTGTTLILGSTDAVRQFYSGLSATARDGGLYTMPCNAMPNVSVTIQGKLFAISAEAFNLGFYDTARTQCVGGIASTDIDDMWILGDIFLQNVYSIFDFGKASVGFADLA
ncbi:aspartic peptidase domain-containing protein [Boletus edulis]|uniref:Asp-domain-containing protein n=1 Tax=Boletus edulis BED1 TaxID=1328754 RepID=A0AAD4BQI8_BOLED|nr:aspartic peptidase domain-containing protein [Boletus edulis]KAF8437585.1 Asp-domain-containing protein [Boletus edulis BED1]